MNYVLAISGHPSKFSRPGFLLQVLARHLHPYRVELRVAHAVDLKDCSVDTFSRLSSLLALVRNARAVLLLAPVPSDDWSGYLKALLARLPDGTFQHKPMLLVGGGGFVGEIPDLERALAPELQRLAVQLALPSLHVGIKNWVFVEDEPPSLTTGTEARLASALYRLCALTVEAGGLSEAA
jgi:NAD(P)H-dependent FMN reductase